MMSEIQMSIENAAAADGKGSIAASATRSAENVSEKAE